MNAWVEAAGVADKFWPHVNRDSEDGCWLWTGPVDTKGYGRMSGLSAHQVAWVLEHDVLPKSGLHLHHTCFTPLCVRVDHLEVLTAVEHRMVHRKAVIRFTATHCGRGHAWDEANTYWHEGRRYCRACNLLRKKERRAELMAKLG